MNQPLTVLPDPAALSARVAAAVAETLTAAVAARGEASIALSGGTTPRALYRRLAREYGHVMAWPRIHVFWGDERYVPAHDERSNRAMAYASLLDHVPVDPSHVHPMSTDAVDAVEAAKAYEATLRAYFGKAPPRFDLVLLGLGADGHTASLFPGSAALTSDRWVAAVQAPAAQGRRLTLTPSVILQAHCIYVVVAGPDKADALACAVAGGADPAELPAAILEQATGTVMWWADRAAAATVPDQE